MTLLWQEDRVYEGLIRALNDVTWCSYALSICWSRRYSEWERRRRRKVLSEKMCYSQLLLHPKSSSAVLLFCSSFSHSCFLGLPISCLIFFKSLGLSSLSLVERELMVSVSSSWDYSCHAWLSPLCSPRRLSVVSVLLPLTSLSCPCHHQWLKLLVFLCLTDSG